MQLIPEEYEYNSVNGDAFVSTDATTQIKEGTEVRVRIVGVRADAHDMVSLLAAGCWWVSIGVSSGQSSLVAPSGAQLLAWQRWAAALKAIHEAGGGCGGVMAPGQHVLGSLWSQEHQPSTTAIHGH
jgi:hypothetical protein